MLCWLKLDFLGGAEIREDQWRRKPHISKDLPLPSQATRKDVQLDEVDHCTKRRKACISHLVRQRSRKLNRNWEEFLRPLCSTLCLEPEGLWRSFWRPAEYFKFYKFSFGFQCPSFAEHFQQMPAPPLSTGQSSQTEEWSELNASCRPSQQGNRFCNKKISKVKTNKK